MTDSLAGWVWSLVWHTLAHRDRPDPRCPHCQLGDPDGGML